VDEWQRWLAVERYTGLTEQETRQGTALLAAIRGRLLQETALAAGEAVLEIGCGAGEFLPALLQTVGAGGRVAALDVSDGLCAQARAVLAAHPLGAVGEVVRGDMAALPFPPATFDVVVCRAVLQYAEQALPAVAAEIARVLRPGGRFASFEMLSAHERPLLPVPHTAGAARAHARAAARWRTLPFRLARGALVRAFAPPAFGQTTVQTSIADWRQPFSSDRFARILAQVPRPRCPTLGELYCADLGPQERQEWDSLIAGASHVAQRGAWAYVTAVR
jgi:SAM-dependent methyltransferase